MFNGEYQLIKRSLSILKEIQHSEVQSSEGMDDANFCPVCKEVSPYHKESCELKDLINDLEKYMEKIDGIKNRNKTPWQIATSKKVGKAMSIIEKVKGKNSEK